MKWSQAADSEIKKVLKREAEKVEEERDLYYQIRKQIYIKGREKEMKHGRLTKKGIVIALSMTLLATGTIFAAGVSGWDMKLLKSYEEYPTQEEIKEESSFLPKFVKELPGGYTFAIASTHKGELIDEYNHVSDEGHELTLRYYAPGKEADMPAIAFHATDILEHVGDGSAIKREMLEYKDITLGFSDTTRKYVPVGYEMTKEDKERLKTEEGSFFIEETEDSYFLELGVDERQEIFWIEDGIGYVLGSMDMYQFTQEEFLEMAKAIIDSES